MGLIATIITLFGGIFLLAFGLAILAILGAWYRTVAVMLLAWICEQVAARMREWDHLGWRLRTRHQTGD